MVNLQHDCYSQSCSLAQIPVRQEREVTQHTRSSVAHSDTIHYILNTHSLHNHEVIERFTLSLYAHPEILGAQEALAFRQDAAKIVADKRQMRKLAREAKRMETIMGRAPENSNEDEEDAENTGDTEGAEALAEEAMQGELEQMKSLLRLPASLKVYFGAKQVYSALQRERNATPAVYLLPKKRRGIPRKHSRIRQTRIMLVTLIL